MDYRIVKRKQHIIKDLNLAMGTIEEDSDKDGERGISQGELGVEKVIEGVGSVGFGPKALPWAFKGEWVLGVVLGDVSLVSG